MSEQVVAMWHNTNMTTSTVKYINHTHPVSGYVPSTGLKYNSFWYAISAIAQSFKPTVNGDPNGAGVNCELTSVQFLLRKVPMNGVSPTGCSLTAKLYSHVGTFGDVGSRLGTLLAVSNPVPVESINTVNEYVTFTFPSGTYLQSGVPYFIVIEAPASPANFGDESYNNSFQYGRIAYVCEGSTSTTIPRHPGIHLIYLGADQESMLGTPIMGGNWVASTIPTPNGDTAFIVNGIVQGGTQQYSLTISVSGQGTTDPVPNTYTKSSGETVPVRAIAGTNYTFDHWVVDGTPLTKVQSVNPYPLIMNTSANRTIQAVFIQTGGGETTVGITGHVSEQILYPIQRFGNCSGATVTAGSFQTTTDASGNYSINGLQPNTYYNVTATKSGKSASQGVTTGSVGSSPVTVAEITITFTEPPPTTPPYLLYAGIGIGIVGITAIGLAFVLRKKHRRR